MCEWENMPSYIDPKYVGFVYLITNLTNGKYYVGKKMLVKRVKSKVNKLTGPGKKTKIRKVESDWKEYWGSCNDLLADIKKLGKKNFTRRVLHLCETKFILAYAELTEQVNREVLFDPKSYNQIVNVRLRKAKPQTA